LGSIGESDLPTASHSPSVSGRPTHFGIFSKFLAIPLFARPKILEATEVHAMVVHAKREDIDMAEVIVGSPQQTPPMYRLGANLKIKLSLGDSIFAGRIVGIAPLAGLRQWVIRAHGPMRLAGSGRTNGVRIAAPIKSLNVSISTVLEGNKRRWRTKLTLDPELAPSNFF
jgi:hypothetical protein